MVRRGEQGQARRGHRALEILRTIMFRAGEHPWPVTAFRLLTLTGAQLSEVLNPRWD